MEEVDRGRDEASNADYKRMKEVKRVILYTAVHGTY